MSHIQQSSSASPSHYAMYPVGRLDATTMGTGKVEAPQDASSATNPVYRIPPELFFTVRSPR